VKTIQCERIFYQKRKAMGKRTTCLFRDIVFVPDISSESLRSLTSLKIHAHPVAVFYRLKNPLMRMYGTFIVIYTTTYDDNQSMY
jgi:hypothetical protein